MILKKQHDAEGMSNVVFRYVMLRNSCDSADAEVRGHVTKGLTTGSHPEMLLWSRPSEGIL